MHNELIQDLASILVIGGLLGWLFKRIFKLPLLLGYIFAGILLALPIPYTPTVIKQSSVHTLAEIGILLIMFSMGLHFGLQKIQKLDFSPIFIGTTQALLMWFLGTRIGHAFAFHSSHALFFGAVIAASSTAVIIKVLEDQQLKSARFAEKLTSILLIEDSVVIFILIWLSAAQKEIHPSLLTILPIFLGSIIIWWIAGTVILPRIIHAAFKTGKDELLVILSIGFALGLAYISSALNFSPALGAFIMGSIISECREIKRIENLIKPVKDIFALVFFVSVGLLFSPIIIIEKYKLIIVLSLSIIFGKFIFNFILNIFIGQGIKDAIRISGSMGQIAEMSFVIAQIALLYAQLDEKTFSAIVATAIITILIFPYSFQFFLKLADKCELFIPTRLYKWQEVYSTAVLEFSLKNKFTPIYEKLFLLKWLKNISKTTQIQIKQNYKKITSQNVTTTLDRLAPWDEYLMPVHVDHASKITGKILINLKLREHFNVNVVAIEREGHNTIVSPKPDEMILGGDTLLIYGNELSIKSLEEFCQSNDEKSEQISIDDCTLASISLKIGHPFIGKSIVGLGIRINYNCLVLAINRNNLRIKNPVSHFIFKENDEVFVFGTKKSLNIINSLLN